MERAGGREACGVFSIALGGLKAYGADPISFSAAWDARSGAGLDV